MQSTKYDIKWKIAQDKIEEAIFILFHSTIHEANRNLFNEVILISLAYHRSKQDYRSSVISTEAYNINTAKVAKRLLELIDSLPPTIFSNKIAKPNQS